MSSRPTVRYTYRDYLTIPEDPARRHEIVDGELHVSAAPRVRHQQVVGNLLSLFGGLVREHRLGELLPGPVTVRLRDDLVLEPDIVCVRRDRMEIVDPEGGIHGPPDLVVEVLSPSNRAYDRELKRKRYLENGVPEVWIVDADERSVEVWKPGHGGPHRPREVLEWAVGDESLRVPVEELFEGI